MKAYLLAMFVLPLLDLFDRWKARHTDELKFDAAFSHTPRFGWHEGEHAGHVFRVFHVNVPIVRSWRRSSALANFQLGYREGWHTLLMVRFDIRGPKYNVHEWRQEWLPCRDCVSVPPQVHR